MAIALNCSNEELCHSNGKLQYNSVRIDISADTNGMTIINADNAANDIGCGGNVQWPTIIDSALIYGMRENLVEISFRPVDLCDIVDNEQFISYYSD